MELTYNAAIFLLYIILGSYTIIYGLKSSNLNHKISLTISGCIIYYAAIFSLNLALHIAYYLIIIGTPCFLATFIISEIILWHEKGILRYLSRLKESRIKSELARKSFHSLMAIILIPQILYGKEGGLWAVYAIPPILLTSEYIRLKNIEKCAPYLKHVLFREEEIKSLGPHIYFAVAILLLYTINPSLTTIIIAFIIAIADATTAITGISIGKHKIPFNKEKHIEGTISGTITLAILLLLVKFPIPDIIIATTLFAILDAIKIPINDNLSMEIIIGTYLII